MAVYERIPAEEIVEGAITVAIHETPEDGVRAWVKWGPFIADGVHRHGDFEGPLPVPGALERAAQLGPLYELDRVVVYLESDGLWQPQWGTLVTSVPLGARLARTASGGSAEA